MSAFIDVVGSAIIAMALALGIVQMRESILERTHVGSLQLGADAARESVRYMLEHDLRKIGLGVSGNSIALADSTRIRFYGDVDTDGDVDTVYYYLGNPSQGTETANPLDRPLTRVVNGIPVSRSHYGIIAWQFTYYDAEGDSSLAPPDLGSIRKLRLIARVESQDAYDAVYGQSTIRLTVRPRNLRY